ncbi:protein arginine N-methyltransferase 9-like isoform X2 [Dermacentor albipictus]|uniref:protein arginine N-methyltransferase 9-like isoform X2 n=1 Tax=Dermacentor albipictus TaxID=60249 RepID=UPI0031FDFECE
MSLSESRKKMFQYSLSQIETCIENGTFGRALAHFCVVFKLQPSTKNDLKEAFLLAVGKHTDKLEAEERWTELFDCYEELLKAYYSCEELHHSLGALLLRHGHIKAAACSIRKALEINPNFTAARQSLDGLRTLLIERWHFRMLNDLSRNEAFHDAITAAVQKGHKNMLDIGAGTGLLSVTLVVTETFDAGLFGEHVLKSLNHAWKYLLNVEPSACCQPKATVIPENAEVFACLVESQWIRSSQKVSRDVLEDILKLENVELNAASDDEQPYDSEKLSQVKHGFLRLSEPFHLLSVDFNSHKEIKNLIKGIQWREKVCCTQSGILDAVCLWFRLKVGDAWLDTGPDSNSCWEQAIFTGPSAQVSCGEVVELAVSCQSHISMRCTLESPGKASQKKVLSLEPAIVRAINGQAHAMAQISEKMSGTLEERSSQSILDISSIPILGLLLVQRQPNWRLTCMHNSDLKDIVAHFVKAHKLEVSVYVAESLEELYSDKQKQYDVFIVNVLESSGLLRQGILEDIALLRKSCLKPDVTMVPSSVTLRALLVESETLEKQSRLVSDSSTLGFRIADSINAFQVQMQQDICLATLPHRALSDVFTLLEINMSNIGFDLPEISAVRSVPLLQTGRISGCCYWFEQECFGGITLSSYSVEDTSLQAGVVFSSGVHGAAGTTVRVGTSCVDSNINIWLDNVKNEKVLQ